MDFRLPGLDGAEATAAIRARTPDAASCASRPRRPTPSARPCSPRAPSGLIEKGSSIDELVAGHPFSHRTRGRESVNLTAENTAIVLDSTSDFPEAAERFPNMRVVPLYVNFGDESFSDHVDIGSRRLLRAAQGGAGAADDVAADAAGLPRRVRSSSAGYERIYALQLSAKLSGTYQSAVIGGRARWAATRSSVVDTETASLAVGAARARDPAPARRAARPTRRSRR